jgi:hypothetical protein
VTRWYEALKLEAGNSAAPDHHLMREVNHATGNLVHRMFYWAELLGDRPPEDETREAVEHLKGSLGELHRLITRTLDLVRVVEARPIQVGVPDLVCSVALRLGTEAEWTDPPAVREALERCELGVDPLLVERATGLVAEALSLQPRDVQTAVSVSSLQVRCSYAADANPERQGLLLHCVIRRNPVQNSAEPSAPVTDAVGIALARKLLAALGWLLDLDETNEERRLVLFIPLSLSPELTTSIALS